MKVETIKEKLNRSSVEVVKQFALDQARSVEHLITDQRVKSCNDVTEKYLRGTLEELEAAVRAANAAADASYAAAAADASYAAYVAYAAANAAANAAAYVAYAAANAAANVAYAAAHAAAAHAAATVDAAVKAKQHEELDKLISITVLK
jgi:hypothetical protein